MRPSKSLLYLFAPIFFLSCSKNKLTTEDINNAQGENRITRYELGSMSFYNVRQEIDSTGQEVNVITDSAKLELKELHNGNILALHSIWIGNTATYNFEGEYTYGENDWISVVKNPATGAPEKELGTLGNSSRRVFTDYETGLKARFPFTPDGRVSYFLQELSADTIVDDQAKKKSVEIYSDSTVFSYSGNTLAQYEVYNLRSDSFAVPYGGNGQGNPIKTSPADAWKEFLKGEKGKDSDLEHTKDDAVITEIVYISPSEKLVINPLFRLMAPLSFEIMDMPYLHSPNYPGMITTNAGGTTKIRQYKYVTDSRNRPLEISEIEVTSSNDKNLKRLITFNYKK
ncbi:MAG: hypothetical protein ACPF8V_09640 [Luteibaculum sp.]